MAKNNKELEEVRLFVAALFNSEQDEHSKLLAKLKSVIGKTKEYEDVAKVLNQVYDSKVEILKKIYNKIQSV